ncbi:unnamed protein product [Leptidea sinapis]|uniref:Uncharacterized protein n=1 Tax=Leptidea sinapis TaxID=189913 RepID=A0A5E4QFG4_9NEOP|nr:unnamed protein product [Leptidea sinapis]
MVVEQHSYTRETMNQQLAELLAKPSGEFDNFVRISCRGFQIIPSCRYNSVNCKTSLLVHNGAAIAIGTCKRKFHSRATILSPLTSNNELNKTPTCERCLRSAPRSFDVCTKNRHYSDGLPMLAPTRPIKPTYRQVALYTLAQYLGPMCTAGLWLAVLVETRAKENLSTTRAMRWVAVDRVPV